MLFSLLDSLTKSTAGRIRSGGLTVLRHWEPYAMLPVGITALVLSQSAFQAGSLAVSLPVIAPLEPIGAVITGVAVFDERLAASPPAVLTQAAAAGLGVLDRAAGSLAVGPRTVATAPSPVERQLLEGGWETDPEDLAHVSPYRTEHI